MWSIVIGVILFLIGGGSFLAAQEQGGTIWIGGMIVGAILVFTGIMRLSRNR